MTINHNYFQIPAMSGSKLLDFAKLGPEAWAWKYESGEYVDEVTDALRFGKALHGSLLEDREYPLWPQGDGRTKAVKEARDAFTEEVYWKDADELTDATRMVSAVKAHPHAQVFLEDYIPEIILRWEHPALGQCKALLDAVTADGFIVEFKSTRHTREDDVLKDFINLGYYEKAWWYSEGFEASYGKPPQGFVYIVSCKDRPNHCWVYELSAECLEWGKQGMESNIAAVLNYLAHGCKPKELQKTRLPDWAARKIGVI